MTLSGYVCIHGHFYQPPRENPWLETIEIQDAAYPYHDWNERINAECYEPNSTSRILDGDGQIIKMVNNYEQISFNFGPTLLEWLSDQAPEVYNSILEADKRSQERFSGQGSAIAQAYNHIIMPLANRRDKTTQVIWGISDFQHRFGRRPRGMWLPETAVDVETLDILAEQGIEFTILAPHQAQEVMSPDGEWRPTGEEDLKSAYRFRTPSGRTINLFFYHGGISKAVAFENLLKRGEDFAHKLLQPFTPGVDPELVNIASDGETYGHHHRHGDMALAYAIHHIDTHKEADLTNHAEYLGRYPPDKEVRIRERTSWSCVHGIERWRGNCGCSTGGQKGWQQEWRGPLREALDWLRDELARRYEKVAPGLLKDPWRARDEYIAVILDRSPESVAQFLQSQAEQPLSREQEVTILKLLEMQRHALLMFTSCGWFFNEISGIETVQVLQYAARAMQLSRSLFGEDLENEFLKRLEHAPSNMPEHGNGRHVYETMVKPAMVDLPEVAAHYALSSLFTEYQETTRVYSYEVQRKEHRRIESGEAVLALGWCRVTSSITWESQDLIFAAITFGHHNINCGIRAFERAETYQKLAKEMAELFNRGDFSGVIRLLDSSFGSQTYSLGSLFRDEQRAIMDRILDRSTDEAEAANRWLYRHQAPLMRFLKEQGAPLPKVFTESARFIMNIDLRQALEEEVPDLNRVREALEQVNEWGVELDNAGLSFTLEQTLDRLALQFQSNPGIGQLRRLQELVEFCGTLPFKVNLRRTQNALYRVLRDTYPKIKEKAAEDVETSEWLQRFLDLASELSIKVD